MVANTENGPGARETTKTAFVYAGEGDHAAAAAVAFYRNEPVVRALFDRCDAVLREERGASLLDWMSGESDAEQMLADPALYAFQCALTALWTSLGVRPNVVAGFGVGELAAARASGVLGLEEGLRLAVAWDALTRTGPAAESAVAEVDLDAALSGIEFRPPSIALVNGVTGRVEGSAETLEAACGLRHVREAATHGRCIRTLAERGIEVVVEIGPSGSVDSVIASHWPDSAGSAEEAGNSVGGPVVLSGPQTANGDRSAPNGDTGFVQAVAEAYEAGLPITFAGLFAGETRRRISVPGYPFERRRHWVDSAKT